MCGAETESLALGRGRVSLLCSPGEGIFPFCSLIQSLFSPVSDSLLWSRLAPLLVRIHCFLPETLKHSADDRWEPFSSLRKNVNFT
jgi:hypothetical protein